MRRRALSPYEKSGFVAPPGATVTLQARLSYSHCGRSFMSNSGEWISAADALSLLLNADVPWGRATRAICKRAHLGLALARALHFISAARQGIERDAEVPSEFWWAEGEEALEADWKTGDFETWTRNGSIRMQAFGVTFRRSDIEAMVPPRTVLDEQPTPSAPSPVPMKARGGRPKADWSEDSLIEMARQLYVGDLNPKTQADIERAMQEWLSNNGHEAAPSTVRERARKLWQAINRVEK